MKVSDALVNCLIEEGVETVFGYPGAAVIPIYESLRTSSIHHVLVRQEQAAVHCASGYARVRHTVGVCLATSGPGATNLITGIATAYMDSIPLIVLTGQVKSNLIGRDVFQEVDITGATEPFVKHSYLVKNAQELPRILKEAFYIARTGRPGPVLIDIPMDLQEQEISFNYPKEVNIRGYKPKREGHIGQIKRTAKLLKNSERPLICIGGGVVLADAKEVLCKFVEQTKIPAVHTLMGTGVLETNNPYNMGMIGTHGVKQANWALRQADTILFIGARIADRAVTHTGLLDERANIIHIDIDPAEIGKITSVTLPLVGDAGLILKELVALVDERDTKAWIDTILEQKQPKVEENPEKGVNPKLFIKTLSDLLDEEAIITADVGQNQFWTMLNMEMKGNRKVICSGGFGTMGYSIPAGIGASMAYPDCQVVSTLGDGSFQMSLFELGTIVQENIHPLIILFNNSGLGMVRELQRKTTHKEYGVSLSCNPDFVQIAKAYGMPAVRVSNPEEVEAVLKEALSRKTPYFIEVMVSDQESTL